MSTLAWFGFGKFGLPLAERCLQMGQRMLPLGFSDRGWEGARAFAEQHGISDDMFLASCDLVAFCLPRAEDVERIVAEIGHELPPLLVDLSTGSPEVSASLADWARRTGRRYYDCPLSGSPEAIREGKVTVLAGARRGTDPQLEEFLQLISDKIFFFDKPGNGSRAKLVNQFIHLSIMGLLGDAVEYARRQDLNLDVLLPALKSSSAGSVMLSRFGDAILHQTHPCHFSLALALKDIHLVRDVASSIDLRSRYLAETVEQYERSQVAGRANLNFSAVCLREGQPNDAM